MAHQNRICSGTGLEGEDGAIGSRPAPIPARLTIERTGDDLLQVGVAGDWLTQAEPPAFEAVENAFSAGPTQVKAMDFQTRSLGRWDSTLVVFVQKCFEACTRYKAEFLPQALPAGVSALLNLSETVPEDKDASRQMAEPGFFARLGDSSVAAWHDGKALLTFVGENVLACFKLLRGTAQFRWSDMLLVMQECGPKALGIVALINFLVGMILAFIGNTELGRFGASIYSADLVAVATVREMASIMTGIIMCGRTGAAFAAQLGTMKVNQEIEAFQTFGFSPIEFLVLPRMLALTLMMPLLVLFANLISILGGFLVSTLMLHVSPALYVKRTIDAITMSTFLLGVFKGAFFGVVVALTGCLRGMQSGSNAAAVGLATTSAVVTGITAIIASDGVFAVICNALGI